ncbi:MAG TPA: recombinase family protein [Symbiobacteriaceae bacterium]|nr:recombinase family protein [Symbiobacteriaceae bacterium]
MAVEQSLRPDRVAVYIRWSTEEQSDGTTLVEQREGCEYYVKSQGWIVNPALTFIDDGYSGASLDRPGIRQIRQLVQERQIDCVVVLKIDRLSRNIVDATQLVLDEWKDRCHLRCVRQPIDTTSETGRMFFSILATFADFERAQIAERTYQGRIRRVKEGKVATLVQFGLLPTGDPGTRMADPVRAPIVAEMFRKVREERAGVKDLLAWLQSEAIGAPAGEKWNLNTIRRILRNPIYAGRIVYGATSHVKKAGRKTPYKQKRAEPTVVTETTHVPVLVPPDVFDAVQAILDERTEFHSKHRRASDAQHLLTGVATCRCGANIVVHWANGARFYWCSRRVMYGSGACPEQSGIMKADYLDELVVGDLLSTFGDPKLRAEAIRRVLSAPSRDTADLERERERIATDIAKLDKRVTELRLAAGVGDLSLGEWRTLTQGLEEKRGELSERLSQVETKLQRAANGASEERLIFERLGDVDRWHDLRPEEQKELLRRLAHQIELFKPRGYNQPYQVKVTWRFCPRS